MVGFNIINLNAARCRSTAKVGDILRFLLDYDPIIVCIQEISIVTALKVFSGNFQVYANIESKSKDVIGIVSLVRLGLHVKDEIIGNNGRIIGLWIENLQFWNVYPKSGSAYKKERESFFRKDLKELYIQWKDCTKYIFQLGDHNCPHRSEDSLYNSSQHLQKGLISHLQVQGLSDDFLNVHGRNVIMYSRITATSKTRIDYIFSNTSSCNYFQYLPVAGLDHCAALARYDINFEIVKEVIPSDRYFQGWVISRFLECDDVFLEQAEFII